MCKIFYIVAAFLFSTTLAGPVAITPCGDNNGITVSVDVDLCSGTTNPCELQIGASVTIVVSVNIPAPQSYNLIYAFVTVNGATLFGPYDVCAEAPGLCPASGTFSYPITTTVPPFPGTYNADIELRVAPDRASDLIYCGTITIRIVS
uniref:MD-2-related lipid-recognition domain-containing protein n=1 Tax=Phlebotomus papatasi TaxID=29031 RepID=A0A1B0DI21_PHLPP